MSSKDCGTGACDSAPPTGDPDVAVSLVVARESVADALAVFDAEWKRGLSEEQIAALEASAGIVLDPEAPETTCPACLTTFATGPAECPDCGLSLG